MDWHCPGTADEADIRIVEDEVYSLFVKDEPYSFSRLWFATQPPKVRVLAYERRERLIRLDRWPQMSRVKSEYRRRNR